MNDEQSPILNIPHKKNMVPRGEESKITQDYVISILCVFFGIGTWLPVNAILSQMPILVQFTPEKSALPSYFALLVQSSNIVPLVYYIFHKKLATFQSSLICVSLIVGALSLFGLAFTYHITTVVFYQTRSTYFFLFSFALSAVGCLSSVLFLPFLNKLPERNLIPYFIGEGLSGLIPSVIALVQGVGKEVKCIKVFSPNGTITMEQKYEEPLFSTKFFLIIIGIVMLMSTASFCYLNYLRNFITCSNTNTNEVEARQQQISTRNPSTISSTTLSKSVFRELLALQLLINAFANGILPSIQSYSCLPYGMEAYHWSVNLNLIIGLVVMYFAFFLPMGSLRILSFCCLLQALSIFYELLTAFMSPNPPLRNSDVGVILIILVWTIGSGLISYIKLSVATIFRTRYKSLINYGMVTQIGSALGSVLSFVLINILRLFSFEAEENCT